VISIAYAGLRGRRCGCRGRSGVTYQARHGNPLAICAPRAIEVAGTIFRATQCVDRAAARSDMCVSMRLLLGVVELLGPPCSAGEPVDPPIGLSGQCRRRIRGFGLARSIAPLQKNTRRSAVATAEVRALPVAKRDKAHKLTIQVHQPQRRGRGCEPTSGTIRRPFYRARGAAWGWVSVVRVTKGAATHSDSTRTTTVTSRTERSLKSLRSAAKTMRSAVPLTGLSRNTLYSLLKAGEVPGARKLGNTWRFTRTTFFDWLGHKVS